MQHNVREKQKYHIKHNTMQWTAKTQLHLSTASERQSVQSLTIHLTQFTSFWRLWETVSVSGELKIFEVVESFTYLGSQIHFTGSSVQEIKQQASITREYMLALRPEHVAIAYRSQQQVVSIQYLYSGDFSVWSDMGCHLVLSTCVWCSW